MYQGDDHADTGVGQQKAVRLLRRNPGADAFEMSADHFVDFLHRIGLRAQHIAAPPVEQQARNVWLLGGKVLAGFLAVLPSTCSVGRGHLGGRPIELRALCVGERGAIL